MDAKEQIAAGWFLKWHPKMKKFYTYDPNDESRTYGRAGMSKAEVRSAVKRGELVNVGTSGEIYKGAV